MKRRILATALTLCLTLSLVPTAAFAAGDKTFDDVNGHWGQASVERWAGYGVLNGDDFGNFNPDKQMTRAEFATMLANMMGYTAKASSSFGDVASDAWYADAILKLAAAGVMLGDNNGNANPNKPISRAEAAVMLCRAFNIQPSNSGLNFADSGDVADWAKGSMAALAEKGMMNGVGNNQLAPLANITRASVAKLVDNMVSEYVTESKEITGTVNGIVLVVGSADVTVKDATLTENLIVAPKAEGAEVTLTGSTTATDVYVDAAASVKVDAQASAGEVQLSAPKASAEVAGKADTVTTTAAAAEATVTVAKDATVSKVEVAAPNTGVNVAGKVENVNVASTAAGTEVKTESGAAVSNVTTSANDVKVSGNGKVENVTANGGTASVTTPGTNVENKTDSADNVTANGKPVPPSGGGTTTPTKPGGSGGGGGGGGDRPSATTYTITVDSTVANGTIAANPTSAAEGATVTITGTPAAGYALKSVTVTREAAEPEPPAEGDGGDNADTPAGQAEETNTVVTTPAGDNEFTFTMPAGNVTVTGEFYQPLTGFQVLLIDSKEDYARLPDEFKIWDGSPESAGWDNLADYPWLAITGKATDAEETSRTGTLNISFKSGNSEPKTVSLPSAWGQNVVGSHGALTAYVTEPPEYNSDGDKLGITEQFGDFTVTLTYKGATYTSTASYIAKDAEAYVVSFNTNGGSVVASQTVAKGGTATKPADPTKEGYTFAGWFKGDEQTAFDFNTAITENVELKAKWTSVEYTLSYVIGNDATGTIADSKVHADSTGLKANDGVAITAPTGKYLQGWAFTENAAKENYAPGADMTASDLIAKANADKKITLYAVWGDTIASTVTYEAISSEAIYNLAVNLENKPKFDSVDLTITVDSADPTKWTASGSLDYVTGFTGFNTANPDEQEGYYVLVGLLFNPDANETIRKTDDVVFTYGSKTWKGTDYANVGLSDGKIQVATMMHYNPAPENQEDKKITFTVDWDGKGTKYTSTTYTIDLSEVTFTPKTTTE